MHRGMSESRTVLCCTQTQAAVAAAAAAATAAATAGRSEGGARRTSSMNSASSPVLHSTHAHREIEWTGHTEGASVTSASLLGASAAGGRERGWVQLRSLGLTASASSQPR